MISDLMRSVIVEVAKIKNVIAVERHYGLSLDLGHLKGAIIDTSEGVFYICDPLNFYDDKLPADSQSDVKNLGTLLPSGEFELRQFLLREWDEDDDG